MLRVLPLLISILAGIITFFWLKRSQRDDCIP